MSSGGMPSSHSSTVCSMVVATGKLNGTHSVTFALAFVMAFIVMYDAAGVRRAAGEQAKVLNKIVHDISTGESRYLDKNLKELIGAHAASGPRGRGSRDTDRRADPGVLRDSGGHISRRKRLC